MMALLPLLVATASLAAPQPIPAFSTHTLDNGLTVVLRHDRQSPWLEVHLALGAGANADPAGQEGLASLAAGLLTAGVAADGDLPAHDETQLADALAGLGASLSAHVDRHTLVVSGAMPTFDAEGVARFLALLRAVALRPSFPEARVARDRTLRLAQLDRLTAQHATLAEAALRQAVHGDGPEGRPDFGTLTSVEGLRRGDLVAWHGRVMTPSHAVLIIGGAFEEKPLLAWLARHLGAAGWPADRVRCERPATPALAHLCARLCDPEGCLSNPSAAPSSGFAPGSAAPVADRSPAPGPRRLLVTVEADASTQVQWRMGFRTPVRLDDPAYGPLRMGFHLLGGDFTSRLNQVLRVREGLTYGAYAQADFGGPRPDLAVIRSDAPPAQLLRALTLTRGLLAELRATPVSAPMFPAMQQNLLNTFAFRFESLPATLSQLRFLAVNRLPTAWLASWTDTVATVSAEAVRDAFARHVPADGGHLVVVGPASLEADLLAAEADLAEAGGAPEPTRWAVVSAAELLARGLPAALRATAAPAPSR